MRDTRTGLLGLMLALGLGAAGCFAEVGGETDDIATQQAAVTAADAGAAVYTTAKTQQETQMSYNLQYLQLQNQMQNENRQFTMVSNIMKTKHDTTKDTISNVR